jgi:hypothetical protein
MRDRFPERRMGLYKILLVNYFYIYIVFSKDKLHGKGLQKLSELWNALKKG